jgi:hypothetical protein
MSITTKTPTCARVVDGITDLVQSAELNVLIETRSNERDQTVSFKITGAPNDGEYIADFIAEQSPDGVTFSQTHGRHTEVRSFLGGN